MKEVVEEYGEVVIGCIAAITLTIMLAAAVLSNGIIASTITKFAESIC
ncbi:MAG: hypothetical protein RSF88_06165 [Lachnospiraceae bacterium]